MAQGGEKAKRLLLLFVLLVFVLVSVRLWSDSKRQSLPFPNFIATSGQWVAITWGKDIYFLDHAGKVLRKQSLPDSVVPTQLKCVGEELWIGDYAGKTISRVKSGGLETVVNGSGRFRGAFKFAVDLRTGEIFVTDSSNHRVHIFAMDGRYLKSFGKEGKGPGGLMFPNTVVFDGMERLLISNTNAQRLDIYQRDGEFVEPFALVEPQGTYRYPTLLARAGDRVALLLTVNLLEAKGVVYGGDGKYIGELPAPKQIMEAGDVGAWEGKFLLSDRKERRVYCFSADTLSYMGPFSAELDALGNSVLQQERLYGHVADGALYLLLAASLPLIFLYLRVRRSELKAIAAVDYGSLVPEEVLMTTALDRRKLIAGIILSTLSALSMSAVFVGGIKAPSINMALLLIAGLMMFFGWLCYMKCGFADPARKETLERLLKALHVKVSGTLLPNERVEGCVALRSSPWSNKISLLLCSDQRMLSIDLSVNMGGMMQIGYGNIDSLSLAPVQFASQPLRRLLGNRFFTLNLSVSTGGGSSTLNFTGTDRGLLEQLRDLLETRRDGGERLDRTVICDGCCRPVTSSACPECAAGKKENWKPLILSCVFPGLGQFYNRELARGTLVSAFFSAGIISLIIPVTKMVQGSAEFTSVDVNFVAQNIVGLLFLYTVSCLDADQVGRKGRKLFSAATGHALTTGLQKRIARLQPSHRRTIVEFLPGLPHALAGSYRRGAFFMIPTTYMLWTTCWSLLSIATGHEVSLDFYVFGCGSAVTAMLWVWMNVDGLRLLERRPVLKVTPEGILSICAPPLLTVAGAIIVQFAHERLLLGNPLWGKAIHTFFHDAHRLVFGSVGYAPFDALMFPGWGGAVMAFFAGVAWQSGKSRKCILKRALAGLIVGIFIWTFCASLLGGMLGGAVLAPVAFGASLGLAVYLYARNDGASPLLVPAIIAGAIVGNAVMISSLPLVFWAKGLKGHTTSLLFAVAIPAYFIHLAYQLVTAAAGGRRP